MNPAFTQGDGGVFVRVHVQPRASRSEVVGLITLVSGATSRAKRLFVRAPLERVEALAGA